MKRNAIRIVFLFAALGAGAFALYTHMMPGPVDPVPGYGFAVGELAPDLPLVDLNGQTASIEDYRGRAGVVVALRDSECPVSQRYGPRLARMEAEYGERDVAFLFLNASPQDDDEEMRADAASFGFAGPYIADREQVLGAALRARTTAEVFVFDRSLTLRYRGAVDDQYGITFTKPEPRNRYLRDALDEVLAGEDVSVSSSVAEGCHLGIDHDAMPVQSRAVTYHERVSRIIQGNCQTCHRTGGVAPIPFESYEDVYGRRAMIQYVLNEGIMPPWFADPEIGTFKNDRSLDLRDRRDLLAWIDAGAPEGDAASAPLPRRWTPGWQLGKPDAILQIEEAVAVPAEGVVDYQYVYVKTDFGEDKWVRQMEVRPTAPEVTHHVLVFIEPPGVRNSRKADLGGAVFQSGLNGFFTGLVPGWVGNVYPEGSAKLLPKGAWLKFQLHYTPNGKATFDQTQIGLSFTDGPPKRVIETNSAWNTKFVIPPGARRHEVQGEYTFNRAGEVLSFIPHMHLRGTAFRFDAIYPDGHKEPILSIPRFDFNWQLNYGLETPLAVTPGTRIRATGWFDNSEDNPANPDPTEAVRFGEQNFNEMMIGYFDWIPSKDAQSTASHGG